MKKVMLSMLAIAFAATTVMAGGTTPVKTKAKAKQATCTKCSKTQKCGKQCANTCDKKDVCCN